MRVVSLAALLSLAVPAGAAGAARAAGVPGQVVVAFRHGAHPALARAASGAHVHQRLGHGLQVLEATDPRAAIHRLRRRRDVRFVEPNYRYRIASVTPNDTQYGLQWSPGRIDAPRAWDYTTGSANVKVGIVDTGIDLTHPDLFANVWTNPGETPGDHADNDGDGFVDDLHGYDFVDGDADPDDPGPPPFDASVGHGTHVAGIAGAVGNNATGIAGIAWTTSLIAARACDTAGVCTTAAQAAAINYSVARGARVVNLSIEGSPFSQAVDDAVRLAPGVLFVAAAGNAAANVDTAPVFPCAIPYPNLICVAASDSTDGLSSFSNFGASTVDLAAPGGVDESGQPILSAYPGGNTYLRRQGTSMAAPQVAGAAALLASYAPAASVATLRDALLSSVDPVPALAGKVATGGRLNAFRALAALDTTPPDTTLTSLPPTPTRSTSVSFAFETDERNTGFECRLDTAPFAACSSPLATPGLADGQHQFLVRAVDPHPNADPSPATANFVVDTTGPAAHFDIAPPAVTNGAVAHFAFSFDEGATDVACSLDGGVFAACTNRFDATVAEGAHSLQVRAADLLGNVATASRPWTVDRTSPGVLVVSRPPALTTERTATIGFAGSEPVAFRCRLDNGPATDCGSPVTFTGLADGDHHATITASDAAGNTAPPATVDWTVEVGQLLSATPPVSVARPLQGPLATFVGRLAARPAARISLRYRARTAGRLELTITDRGRLIRTARARLGTPQTVTLDVRLPRAERRAIRREHHPRLRVDVSFTPRDGRPAAATRRIRF